MKDDGDGQGGRRRVGMFLILYAALIVVMIPCVVYVAYEYSQLPIHAKEGDNIERIESLAEASFKERGYAQSSMALLHRPWRLDPTGIVRAYEYEGAPRRYLAVFRYDIECEDCRDVAAVATFDSSARDIERIQLLDDWEVRGEPVDTEGFISQFAGRNSLGVEGISGATKSVEALMSGIVLARNWFQQRKEGHLVGNTSLDDEVYNCDVVESGLDIDGALTDESWRRAKRLKLVVAHNGQPANQITTAKALWNSTTLFVGVHCFDRDIRGKDGSSWGDDFVTVFLDDDIGDGSVFRLRVNPFGDYEAAVLRNNDGVIERSDTDSINVAVMVKGTLADRSDVDSYWTIEAAIPLNQIDDSLNGRFAGDKELRFQLVRIDRNSPSFAEVQAWIPVGRGLDLDKPSSDLGTLSFSQ